MTIPARLIWGAILAAAVLGLMALPPDAEADPHGTTCPQNGSVNTYTTYVPCPDWEFLPPRPADGGNHRWTDGSDD